MKEQKRRGRHVGFDKRVPKVYAKLAPFWDRVEGVDRNVQIAGDQTALRAAKQYLRRVALKWVRQFDDINSEAILGRDAHLTEELQRELDLAAMRLAATAELALARTETAAQLEAAERARKPRAQKARKAKARKPRATRVLPFELPPTEKPARKPRKKAKRAKK